MDLRTTPPPVDAAEKTNPKPPDDAEKKPNHPDSEKVNKTTPKPPRAPPSVLRRTLLVHDEPHTSIPVRLSIPSDLEECPLSLVPIKDDELPFLPGVTYSRTYPLIKKITLPCDHSFGVMNLLFHFAQNKTRCPMCRYGAEARLDTRSIPTHFRRAIINHIRQADHESALEEIEEDERLARQLFTEFIRDLDSFVTRIYLSVYLILGDGAQLELFQCRMTLIMRVNSIDDSFHFGLSGPNRRALITNLGNINIENIRVGFSIMEGSSEPREISLSDPFAVSHNGSPRTIMCSMGVLTVTSLAYDPHAFRSLLWSVHADNLFSSV
jgi:hypothetical protein